jgi:hypothetical protein
MTCYTFELRVGPATAKVVTDARVTSSGTVWAEDETKAVAEINLLLALTLPRILDTPGLPKDWWVNLEYREYRQPWMA